MVAKQVDRITVIIQKGKRRIVTRTPLAGVDRLVYVINNQYTNAANTTQIASGAGRSSASGSNAAIASPYTRQQQSVGAGGNAANLGGAKGRRGGRIRTLPPIVHGRKEIVVVVNNQTVKVPKGTGSSSATQVGSGGGTYSSGGTNAAIDSPGTRQQQAVGGGAGGRALNKLAGTRRHGRGRPSRSGRGKARQSKGRHGQR
ncbi:hypothetical protein [Paenibacillus sp. NFR01]|uniref:hypothetical protein n=1 Tax=Paenibacillus sp. NFR01 TaxID=1566279 RepID=UPI0008AD8F56|nr:hypothetical protein [Paenibacillus sp. NFR01]SEU11291.1 hypothetical protein SAMN03159358_3387 [Paenibacillus sp. NFR01]